MTFDDLPVTRLARQNISAYHFSRPQDVVSWMGAMQAQDYAMVQWALGVRLPGVNPGAIRDAINKGEIIRTHVVRPTWHLIPAADARWMLDLTAPHIRSGLPSRHRNLGITAAILKKSMKVLEKSLEGCQLTREELLQQLVRHKIAIHDQRAAHLLLCAELEKVVCSGAMKEKKNTYALFDERVPQAKALTRDEALCKLAYRYFQSHGPATLADFVNWSSLPVSDARKALGFIKDDFSSAEIDSQVYWFREEEQAPRPAERSVYLLPAFDEYIIGYKDRSACLAEKHRSKVISINGLFWPVIVINGMVTGLWKRRTTGGRAEVELQFFAKSFLSRNSELRADVAEAVREVGAFFRESSVVR